MYCYVVPCSRPLRLQQGRGCCGARVSRAAHARRYNALRRSAGFSCRPQVGLHKGAPAHCLLPGQAQPAAAAPHAGGAAYPVLLACRAWSAAAAAASSARAASASSMAATSSWCSWCGCGGRFKLNSRQGVQLGSSAAQCISNASKPAAAQPPHTARLEEKEKQEEPGPDRQRVKLGFLPQRCPLQRAVRQWRHPPIS